MIDYGINTINIAYNFMNEGEDRVKFIAEKFDSKYPNEKKWNCFIFPSSNSYASFSFNYDITYITGNEIILIFV